MADCPLCIADGETPLWQDAHCRVMQIADADHPGYCHVIWKTHIREMTELAPQQRLHLMRVVFALEAAVQAVAQADKINLASLGNVVPHLHWHVIPRWRDDRHFPNSIWGPPLRSAPARAPVDSATLRRAFLHHFSSEPCAT